MKTNLWAVLVLLLVSAQMPVLAKMSAPPKIVPVSKKEKSKALAAETDEQKALREKLKTLGKIYYNANCDGVKRIYVMNADGSDVKCLTPEATSLSAYPHISPDGKRLLFTRRVSKEILKTLPADKKYPLTGKRLKATLNVVHLLELETGKITLLAVGDEAHWASDGQKITYMAHLSKGRQFKRAAIMDLKTKTEVVFNHRRFNQAFGMPCFTPDSKFLLVSNGPGSIWATLNESSTDLAEDGKIGPLIGGHPCNLEISSDGQWITWVVSTSGQKGSWLRYGAFKTSGRRIRPKNFRLGWDKGSVNYFPEFSPKGSYLVYAHAEQQKGVRSWLLRNKQELYVTTFPDCKTTVRITWNGAANQHPNWAAARVDQPLAQK